jgi:hypothetical protein
MTAYTYRLYGQDLVSSHPFTGLTETPLSSSDVPAIEIHFVDDRHELPVHSPQNRPPDYSLDSIDSANPAVLHMWRSDAYLVFSYELGHDFNLHMDGSEIWACFQPGRTTFGHLQEHVIGSMLGVVLSLRGLISLHAGVLDIDGSALAVMGNSGTGKSTTTLALLQQGFPVISDDIAALYKEGQSWMVHPGPARLKLWEQSAVSVFGQEAALPRIAPDDPFWDKQYYPLEAGVNHTTSARPIQAIYYLVVDEDITAPEIRPMSPALAVARMDENIFDVPRQPPEKRGERLKRVADLFSQVRVREVRRPIDIDQLPAICALITEDFRTA